MPYRTSFYNLALFTLATSLSTVHGNANGQRLQQPHSLLPFASQSSASAPLTAPNASHHPKWILESATGELPKLPPAKSLPMVETESHADLGTVNLEAGSRRRETVQRRRFNSSQPRRSFGLLRSLGFRSQQSSDRR